MRLREVEIHHADLGAGYTAPTGRPDFRAILLDVDDQAPRYARAVPRSARPTSTAPGTTARRAATGPVVTGTVGRLGWWLTGRGSGEGLTSRPRATCPEVETW